MTKNGYHRFIYKVSAMGRPAARKSDMHVCPKVDPGPKPHIGGPIMGGSNNVKIGGMPAARIDDDAVCVGPKDAIAAGSKNVLINGKKAARFGDKSSHGGLVVMGFPMVLIGESSGTANLSQQNFQLKNQKDAPATLATVQKRSYSSATASEFTLSFTPPSTSAATSQTNTSPSYGPLNPGPLDNGLANTFRSGKYQERILEEDEIHYRVMNENSNPTGIFWSSTLPKGPTQAIIDLALDRAWGNSATTLVAAKIPAGTTVYEGQAERQRGLVAGGQQTVILNASCMWIQDVVFL